MSSRVSLPEINRLEGTYQSFADGTTEISVFSYIHTYKWPISSKSLKWKDLHFGSIGKLIVSVSVFKINPQRFNMESQTRVKLR